MDLDTGNMVVLVAIISRKCG